MKSEEMGGGQGTRLQWHLNTDISKGVFRLFSCSKLFSYSKYNSIVQDFGLITRPSSGHNSIVYILHIIEYVPLVCVSHFSRPSGSQIFPVSSGSRTPYTKESNNHQWVWLVHVQISETRGAQQSTYPVRYFDGPSDF